VVDRPLKTRVPTFGRTVVPRIVIYDVETIPAYNLLLYGGRRGGKSDVAVGAGVIMAVVVPGSRVVMVSPTQHDTEELRIAIEQRFLPPEWRRHVASEHTFLLPNGSQIELMTGGRRSLKIGRVDYVLYNEGQAMTTIGFEQLSGGTTDVSGLSVCTCNPPDTTRGQWVQDWYYDFVDGKRPNDRAFFLNPEDNSHIDYGALLAKRNSLSETEYRREVLGDMSTPVGDIVFTAWSDECVLEYIPSGWRDVTERRSKHAHVSDCWGYVAWRRWGRDDALQAELNNLFHPVALPDRARQLARDW
jgi:hypothetical protein